MTKNQKYPVDNLTLAIIASSNAPVLLLSGDLSVISASASLCSAFGIEPEGIAGRPLMSLGGGEWNVPQLISLLRTVAAGHAEVDGYEMDLRRAGHDVRHLVLHIRKLEYGDPENIRLLVAVVDRTASLTAEKMMQDTVHEKHLLFQELQHRIANSLQIIASVLMQSARRVHSEEMRSHLQDAHQRVMSIASMQKQLAVSGSDSVELRPYFTDLCRSIGASMIRDTSQISLLVEADEATASADISTSLGLIVTELVINALKYAFADQRHGVIKVTYRCKGPAWTLSVVDNGVGMRVTSGAVTAGLGTNIITALARHLNATVTITDACPGVSVTIDHRLSAPAKNENI